MEKDHPTYLLQLGIEAATQAADMLIRLNPEGIARGESLTVPQYHQLLNQTVTGLRKSRKLPSKPISEVRFQAFEGPFRETLQKRGLI